MTREEAITELKLFKESAIPWDVPILLNAIDMAIEALQTPPISQRSMYQAGYRQGREEALKQVTGKLNNPDDSLLTADPEVCKEQKSKLDLISREDAIEAIELVDWYHQNSNKDMVSGANSDEHQVWYKAQDIYEALEAVPQSVSFENDTKIKSCSKDSDLISRAEAIDALRYAQHRFTVADEAGGMGSVKWSENVIYFAAAERVLTELPSAGRPSEDLISGAEAIRAITEYNEMPTENCYREYNHGYKNGMNMAVHFLENMPSADRPRGHWIGDKCSVCGEERAWYGSNPPICPDCGAIMDGERSEE